MARYIIEGGRPLSGTVHPIGNKNAVIKMIPASLLTSEPVTLTNVPPIRDVDVMLEIVKKLGTTVKRSKDGSTVTLQTKKISRSSVPADLGRKLRASNVFIGPLLARTGKAEGVVPGGDKIGPREMNAHFDGLSQLGAKITHLDHEHFRLTGRLKGTSVFLYEPSVTATENVIMAASLAKGTTVITNAATEPHVQSLCHMLVSMGSQIDGIGTNRLTIVGAESLSGTTHEIPVDYVDVGTSIVLAAVTGGQMTIKNVNHEDLKNILYMFGKLGLKTIAKGDDLVVPGSQKLRITDHKWARIKGIYSQPWPCFSTDMMSLAIVLATQVQGSTLFFEKMYAGRMFFADFLNGMGANIIIADPHRVIVNGRTKLHGRRLYAPDIRAGMAYVAAGLCAEGTTIVENIEHIDRGYPDLAKSLKKLGAKIRRED